MGSSWQLVCLGLLVTYREGDVVISTLHRAGVGVGISTCRLHQGIGFMCGGSSQTARL